jgi:hypothetical protein
MPTNTISPYAFYKDVENFLSLVYPIDSNSPETSERIDNYIVWAAGEFEGRTGVAFAPRLETNEVLDLDTYRQRRQDTFFPNQIFSKRPVELMHKPILPFDPTRGHKIELFRGQDAVLDPTGADPIRRWDDFLALKYGRNDDYWFDDIQGMIFLRNTFFVRQGRVVRVTYEWGKPITTITSNATSSPATISVASTYRYQYRGIIRIGRTYIFHTGKTANSFTGCTWGVLGTQAEDYDAGSEVYEVPDDVRLNITKRAAAMFLQNETFVAVGGDNSGTSPKYSDKIEEWNKDWEFFLSRRWQRWSNF